MRRAPAYAARMLLTRTAVPLLLLCSCASISIKPIAYTAQPARIVDPAAEVKALILANTVQGCVSEPSVTDTMLTVKYVCTGGGVGNVVARLDRVQTITIDNSGEWYRVLVHHRGGIDDFGWQSKSLEDIQRLADALTALSSPAAAVPAVDASKI